MPLQQSWFYQKLCLDQPGRRPKLNPKSTIHLHNTTHRHDATFFWSTAHNNGNVGYKSISIGMHICATKVEY